MNEVTSTYDIASVSFTCRCGLRHTLNKKNTAEISGLFCQCDQHFWISWHDGVLHNGDQIKRIPISHEETVS